MGSGYPVFGRHEGRGADVLYRRLLLITSGALSAGTGIKSGRLWIWDIVMRVYASRGGFGQRDGETLCGLALPEGFEDRPLTLF